MNKNKPPNSQLLLKFHNRNNREKLRKYKKSEIRQSRKEELKQSLRSRFRTSNRFDFNSRFYVLGLSMARIM